MTQGSPWICFAAWATRGVARTCLKRTRGFPRVTAGQSWLRGSVHVGVGPALSGQVNDRHPVPTLQRRSWFQSLDTGETKKAVQRFTGSTPERSSQCGASDPLNPHRRIRLTNKVTKRPKDKSVCARRDATAQRCSPGLASNRSTVKPLSPPPRHLHQVANRRIRHHPPANSDSCSTG